MTQPPAELGAADSNPQADLDAIKVLDALRCALISKKDMEGFRRLLTDDYIHIHAIGRADTVDDAVESFRRSPRICRRADPMIRLFGDMAVVTGLQENSLGEGKGVRQTSMLVTTVVNRTNDGWKFVSFHGCNVP